MLGVAEQLELAPSIEYYRATRPSNVLEAVWRLGASPAMVALVPEGWTPDAVDRSTHQVLPTLRLCLRRT